MLVKQSGTALADAKWVCCDTGCVQNALVLGVENIEPAIVDRASEGGKPSIEAFFHCLPATVIVHLHPAPLLSLLCRSDLKELHLTGYQTQVIDYAKPGIPLAALIAAAHKRSPDTNVYFLKNHGVLLLGESVEEILGQMSQIAAELFPAWFSWTNIGLCSALAREVSGDTIIKSFVGSPECMHAFHPFTPDIAVFLQSAPLCLYGKNTQDHVRKLHEYREIHSAFPTVIFHESVCYILGATLSQCHGIRDILWSYTQILKAREPTTKELSSEHVHELVHWDKEKERRRG